jgi:hypothetical protein
MTLNFRQTFRQRNLRFPKWPNDTGRSIERKAHAEDRRVIVDVHFQLLLAWLPRKLGQARGPAKNVSIIREGVSA